LSRVLLGWRSPQRQEDKQEQQNADTNQHHIALFLLALPFCLELFRSQLRFRLSVHVGVHTFFMLAIQLLVE
jgi:hypothetical protein